MFLLPSLKRLQVPSKYQESYSYDHRQVTVCLGEKLGSGGTNQILAFLNCIFLDVCLWVLFWLFNLGTKLMTKDFMFRTCGQSRSQ